MRTTERTALLAELATCEQQLRHHFAADPGNFDGREHLHMRRADLQTELRWLEV
jgi:hypothetical protein